MPASFKINLVAILFGIAIVLMDFSDNVPFNLSVGNLDHLLGHRFWYTLEILYPLALIVIFLLFGRSYLNLGRKETSARELLTAAGLKNEVVSPFGTKIKAFLVLLFFVVLVILIDIDDILKVLGIPSALQLSSQSPYYWLPMEYFIFPIGSMIALLVFGQMCYDLGRKTKG